MPTTQHDPEKLLRQAEEALSRGADPAQVDAFLVTHTAGRYRSVEQLRLAASPTNPFNVAPPEERSRIALRDLGRLFVQGATLGGGDEALGVIAGPEAMEADRSRLSQLRQNHPVASLVAETAGGMLVPGLGAAGIGRSILARTGSRLAAGIGGGAAGGAGGGAIAGALEADGPAGARTEGALLGGIMGAGAGGALGGAASVAGRGLRALRDANPPDMAASSFRRILNQSGLTPEEIPSRLEELGPGARISDLSDAIRREARAAVNQASSLERPGGPKEGIGRRAGAGPARMSADLRAASGIGARTFDESIELAEQNLEAIRDRWYRPFEEAYPSVDGPAIREALQNPDIANVARRSLTRPRRVGETPTGQAYYDALQNGTLLDAEDIQGPAFTDLQDVVKDLRDRVVSTQGRPGANARAREALSEFQQAMEADIPGFMEAQRAYARGLARVNAHAAGQKFAMSEPRTLQNEFGKFSDNPEAMEAFRQGMLDKFETELMKGRGTAMMRRIGEAGDRTNDMTTRLRMLVGGDPELNRILQAASREGQFSRTFDAVFGGSTTTQQQNDIFNQIPTSQQGILRSIMQWARAGSPEERMQTAEILGTILLSEGRDAAEDAARMLNLRWSLSSSMGAGLGTAGANQVLQTEDEQQWVDPSGPGLSMGISRPGVPPGGGLF